MNRKTLTLLSGLLVATIPASLVIWYFFFFNLNIHQNSASPIRLFNCFFVSTLFAVYALKKGSVDLSGAITGGSLDLESSVLDQRKLTGLFPHTQASFVQ